MQITRKPLNRDLDEIINFVALGLMALITLAIFLQRPVEWRNALGASGFLLFYAAWTGIYSRLQSELPEHPFATASLFGFRWTYRGRRKQRLLPWRIIRFHFERHRFDLWSMLMIAGVLTIVSTVIRFVD